jgi:murein DD-endopeptidase MepM/ murein hydrolase activator NlpD
MKSLCDIPYLVPDSSEEPGSFAFVRKHDIHCGVDIYLPEGTPIYFISTGIVVQVTQFTGEAVGTPWWNDTWAVYVYNAQEGTTMVYGELYPPNLYVGQGVDSGALCGHVAKVLRVMKGRPMSMLHFEMYSGLVTRSAEWLHGELMPRSLLNPTKTLLSGSLYI